MRRLGEPQSLRLLGHEADKAKVASLNGRGSVRMGVHQKAWSGLNIVIQGPQPLLPAKLAEAISRASPANEVRTTSFENYDDTYDFCRTQKDVGLLLLIDSMDGIASEARLKQLGSHYEGRGWPCAGVLLHEGDATLSGYRAPKSNSNFLAYTSVTGLLDPKKTTAVLTDIWKQFIHFFETSVIPPALQDTLIALAEPTLNRTSYRFYCRVVNTLIPALNISWLETVALNWAPVVNALRTTAPKALEANSKLAGIADIARPAIITDVDITITIKSKDPLPQRVSTLAMVLDADRILGRLSDTLARICSEARPGAPALIRRIASVREAIEAIASQTSISEASTRTA